MFHSSTSSSDVVLNVDHVWKIYCRNLKRAMWYGVKDLSREVVGMGRDRTRDDLRPGEFFAVRDANFEMKQGECLAMIGPNGAGKSTMLKMVNGLVKPDAGSISIRGRVGALIELGTGFNPILSGRENVYINAAVLGMKKSEVDSKFDEIVEFAELGAVINDPIKTYSTGMRVRLGFSVAANLRPQLLIMDEVLAVGDVGFRMKCFAHLRTLVDQGVSIILVTHAVAMLQRVATRAVVFGRGKIVHDGPLDSGISVYEEMMCVKQEHAAGADSNRESNSTAWIEQVEVLNDLGKNQNEFDTGDTVKLKIHLSSKVTLPDARLIVALCSPVHGVLLSMSTPHQNVQFQLGPEGRVVELTLPRIALLIGAYYFNISICGPEITDFYQRRTGIGGFRITGPSLDANGFGINGMVEMDHQWKVE